MSSPDGLGTGMLGFSGLPAELSGIDLFVGVNKGSLITNKHFTKYNFSVDVSDCLNRIQTATSVDQLLAANLKYLKTFCGPSLSGGIYQILTLNRFTDGSQSRYYLKECLKRVGWDGSFTKGMGPAELVWGVFDYFKMTGDFRLIENNWPVLKRIGYAIWHQKVKALLLNYSGPASKQEGFYQKYFWLYAALKALEGLAHSLGQMDEAQIYKEQNLALQSKLAWSLEDTLKRSGSHIIPLNYNNGQGDMYGAAMYGAGIVRNLIVSYPLQLWRSGNSFIKDTIKFILKKYSYRGGIFSPLDFQGIDLALSARMGQVLIREGYDYTPVLELMLAATGDTWSLPDRIHPLTMNGIGENGHDPEVLYQLLLLIRNIFVLEDDSYLDLLPGLFSSSFWEYPKLKVNRLNTYFGEISYNCHRIGDLIQIDFWPQYRIKPEKIRINLHCKYQPVYVDSSIKSHDSIIEISPDFHLLRLKKLKSAGLS